MHKYIFLVILSHASLMYASGQPLQNNDVASASSSAPQAETQTAQQPKMYEYQYTSECATTPRGSKVSTQKLMEVTTEYQLIRKITYSSTQYDPQRPHVGIYVTEEGPVPVDDDQDLISTRAAFDARNRLNLMLALQDHSEKRAITHHLIKEDVIVSTKHAAWSVPITPYNLPQNQNHEQK